MKNKISNAITILCVLLCLLTLYLAYSALFAHRERPNAATKYVELEVVPVSRPYNWKEKLRELFDTPHTVIWKEMNAGSTVGRTNLFTRQIVIEIGLYEPIEVVTYAHELTHLKYFTVNETFTSYQAIITLYESGVPYFRYAALREANEIMNWHAQVGTEYDCGWLLQHYFEKGDRQ